MSVPLTMTFPLLSVFGGGSCSSGPFTLTMKLTSLFPTGGDPTTASYTLPHITNCGWLSSWIDSAVAGAGNTITLTPTTITI